MSLKTVVAIVGGGFSGAAAAFHIARNSGPESVEIVVIEPRAKLGGGLAYSTQDPVHRVNVPADKLTLVSQDLSHFAKWLDKTGAAANDPDAVSPNGKIFPQRSALGSYVQEQIAPYLASGHIRHEKLEAKSALVVGDQFQIELADGRVLRADVLVAAATHPAPAIPLQLAALRGTPNFISDPYAQEGLASIGKSDRVLIVGSGLTSADMIASLERLGHRGNILAISRRGYRSRAHPAVVHEPQGDFVQPPARTAVGLLRRIRAEVAFARGQGRDWHPVLDAVRNQGQAIWKNLSREERSRIVRHLRAIWDVHRFRIAPQPQAAIERGITENRLTYRAAALEKAEFLNGVFHVSIRPRGGEQVEQFEFDAIVVTTGPAHSSVLTSSDFMRSLARSGLVQADGLGLGICVDDQSRTIGAGRSVHRNLYVAGPLARGTFGELMGLPEVTRQAEEVAAEIVRSIGYSKIAS